MDPIDNIENDPTKNFDDYLNTTINFQSATSRYVLPENILPKNSTDEMLNILHLNIHSIPAKMSLLRELIQKLKNNGNNLDIILLCETFVNEKNKMSCSLEDLNYVLIEGT
jgi:hypothetical protein